MGTHLVVGIDIGTTKVCTIVGEVRADDLFVVGVGIEPSRGMKKGVVTDLNTLSAAISASVHKAEKSSGFDIKRAFVSLAGKDVAGFTSRGSVGLTANRGVRVDDVDQAIENARNIAIPHNKEVLHVIPRAYSLDGHEHVRSPLGMHGFRLDVEVGIITAAATSVANLEQALQAALIYTDRFILNPLASGDAVLSDDEREMGVVIIDIGGGTTDLAIFIEGGVWHSAVIPIGGDLITNDLTHWMKVPFDVAEAVKLQYGHAKEKDVGQFESFAVQTYGEDGMVEFKRSDIAMVIEARVTEMFEKVSVEIKRSGYDGLLRAGAVLTGGCAQLPGIREVARDVLNMPVKVAQPERVTGMADMLRNPSYSTSVGLLRLGLQMESASPLVSNGNGGESRLNVGRWLSGIFRGLLPDEE
jgi:cell division protein FtsA